MPARVRFCVLSGHLAACEMQGAARGRGGQVGAPPGIPRPAPVPPVEVPKEEFNFEEALKRFNKEELLKVGVAPCCPSIVCHSNYFYPHPQTPKSHRRAIIPVFCTELEHRSPRDAHGALWYVV